MRREAEERAWREAEARARARREREERERREAEERARQEVRARREREEWQEREQREQRDRQERERRLADEHAVQKALAEKAAVEKAAADKAAGGKAAADKSAADKAAADKAVAEKVAAEKADEKWVTVRIPIPATCHDGDRMTWKAPSGKQIEFVVPSGLTRPVVVLTVRAEDMELPKPKPEVRSRQIRCAGCSETFNDQIAFNNHMCIELDPKPASRPGSAPTYSDAVAGGDSHTCMYCQRKFPTQESYLQHRHGGRSLCNVPAGKPSRSCWC